MSQQSDAPDSTQMPAVSLADENAGVPIEHLVIFSAPGVEVVSQWWLESKRRWAEENRLKVPAA